MSRTTDAPVHQFKKGDVVWWIVGKTPDIDVHSGVYEKYSYPECGVVVRGMHRHLINLDKLHPTREACIDAEIAKENACHDAAVKRLEEMKNA